MEDFHVLLNRLKQNEIAHNKKQKKILLLTVTIGVILGALLVKWESVFFHNNRSFVFFLFTLLFTEVLQVILHEAGHLVFGLLSGYRFVSFRVFSFAIYRKNSKIRFGRYRVAGTMGQCLLAPKQENSDTLPYRALLWGGVIANLLFTLLSLLPLIFCYSLLPNPLVSLLIGTAFWGIILALTNGIPYQSGNIATDGYHAVKLKKSSSERAAFSSQLLIHQALTEGRRLADMPQSWFTLSQTDSVTALSFPIEAFAIDREMELEHFDQAEHKIVSLIQNSKNLPQPFFSALVAELWYLEMIGKHRHNAVEAYRCALDRHLKLTQNTLSTLRILSTYHYLFTGDLKQIEKFEIKRQKRIKHYPFTSEIERETMLLSHPKERYTAWQKQSHR